MCLLRGTDWVFIYNSTFCPHSVFMCFVWIWEQTAIISLYNINWLVFITKTDCVYCAVRTGALYTIHVLLVVKEINTCCSNCSKMPRCISAPVQSVMVLNYSQLQSILQLTSDLMTEHKRTCQLLSRSQGWTSLALRAAIHTNTSVRLHQVMIKQWSLGQWRHAWVLSNSSIAQAWLPLEHLAWYVAVKPGRNW